MPPHRRLLISGTLLTIASLWCNLLQADCTVDAGTCQAQPECSVGQLLGGEASVLKEGKCEDCPEGTFKNADGHQWLTCFPKNTFGCDSDGQRC